MWVFENIYEDYARRVRNGRGSASGQNRRWCVRCRRAACFFNVKNFVAVFQWYLSTASEMRMHDCGLACAFLSASSDEQRGGLGL